MFSHFKYDIKAGLVVFLVALPLCLGIALAQGVPLFSGIIAGVVGGIIVGSISGSKLSVSGPAAGLTSIVISSIAALGSFEAFLLATCIAGIMQIILGVIKAGLIGYYFPTAVIKGMLSAIGIILILKQIPHLVGFDDQAEGDEALTTASDENIIYELMNLTEHVTPGSLIIGIISILILLLWQTPLIKRNKLLKQMPSALLVVIVGILIDLLFNNAVPALEVKDKHLVNLPEFNGFDGFLNSFIHPDFSAFKNPKVYEVAAIIAAVASLETLLSLEAVDKLDPDNQISPTNRELIAQGVGNFTCGLIGGVPVTAVIVRSSVNVSAGGKTQMSAVIHGLFFIVAIFLLPNVLEMIPLSALAGILIMTGYNLSKPALYKTMFKQGMDQFLPFIVTISVMLYSDLLKGVLVGIFISVIFILRQNYRSPFKIIREEIDGRLNVFMKLSQNVTFINKGKFIEVFKSIPVNSIVYIDGGRSTFIDKDVLEIISAFKQSAKIKKIDVILEEVPEVEVLSHH